MFYLLDRSDLAVGDNEVIEEMLPEPCRWLRVLNFCFLPGRSRQDLIKRQEEKAVCVF